MKKFLLLAALACGSLSAMAQSLSLRGTITGTTGEIEIDAETINAYRDCQFDFYTPTGMEVFEQKEYNEVLEAEVNKTLSVGDLMRVSTAEYPNMGHSASYNKLENNHYRIVIVNMGGYKFYSNQKGKSLVKFKVTIDADKFQGGDFIVDAIKFSGDGVDGSFDDVKAISVPVKVKIQAVDTEWRVSTIASPFDIELPDGVTASKGTKKTTGYVQLNETESNTVKAGVPAFLLSKEEVKGLYYYGVPTTEDCKGEILEGVYKPTEINGGLVLSGGTLKTVTSKTSLPAYKAYIPADKAAEVKGVMIGDVVTGLDAISSEEVKTIYSVSGMQLNKAQKGLNIVNGKKFLVK